MWQEFLPERPVQRKDKYGGIYWRHQDVCGGCIYDQPDGCSDIASVVKEGDAVVCRNRFNNQEED